MDPADPGIRRFAIVVPGRLWRGGAVTRRGLAMLADAGCRRVLDLTRRERPIERRACDRLGLAYRKIPLSDAEAPAPGILAALVADLRSGPPALIHCWGGRHRTGLVIATYRITVEGWTRGRARAEMISFDFGRPERRPSLWEALPCSSGHIAIDRPISSSGAISKRPIGSPPDPSLRHWRSNDRSE